MWASFLEGIDCQAVFAKRDIIERKRDNMLTVFLHMIGWEVKNIKWKNCRAKKRAREKEREKIFHKVWVRAYE